MSPRAQAIVLIFVYPLGIPLACARGDVSAMTGTLIRCSRAADFGILYSFRHQVNPKHCDRIDAIQRRNADPDLKPFSFLFSCYAPHAYGFEIFDSYRRIIMQGVLTFAGIDGWTTGPAVLGILLALCSSIVMREIAPCALRARCRARLLPMTVVCARRTD